MWLTGLTTGSRATDRTVYPQAADVVCNVPIYRGDAVLAASRESESRDLMMEEWYNVLLDGPGVFVIKRCEPNDAVLDQADEAFQKIIADEEQQAAQGGDHFGQGGSNDRIWNSFQKHAEVDPAAFVEYYANEIMCVRCELDGADSRAMASEAWLGPGYQMTAQCNIVKPGGAAQKPHRDYRQYAQV